MRTGFMRSALALAAGTGLGLLAYQAKQNNKQAYLAGRVVLITGGSRGLGLAMAEEFASKGARLVLTARDEQELEDARNELAQRGADVVTIACDITNRREVQQLIDQATERFGQIDVLVNNAGIITVGPLMAQTLNDFEESMNIMYWGPFYATMAVLPQMLHRKSGRIVNITSIGGKVAVPHLLPYDSAKFALVGFSEGLRAEMTKEGIKVVTIAPGLMRTGSQVNAFFKGNNRGEYTWFTLLNSIPPISISAKRAAQQIVKATERGRAEAILGFSANLLAKFHGLFPGATASMLGLVNRFLPGAGPVEGLDRKTGEESQTPITDSFLTTLSQKATREYNE